MIYNLQIGLQLHVSKNLDIMLFLIWKKHDRICFIYNIYKRLCYWILASFSLHIQAAFSCTQFEMKGAMVIGKRLGKAHLYFETCFCSPILDFCVFLLHKSHNYCIDQRKNVFIYIKACFRKKMYILLAMFNTNTLTLY